MLYRVGARGSRTSRSPPDSTKVEVTTGCQSAPAVQNGCLARQIQSPGAKSRIPTCSSGGFNRLPQTAQSYLRSVWRRGIARKFSPWIAESRHLTLVSKAHYKEDLDLRATPWRRLAP